MRTLWFEKPLDEQEREAYTPERWKKVDKHAKILGDFLGENGGTFLMRTTSRSDDLGDPFHTNMKFSVIP
jgi:hypothetical protein